MVRFVLGLIATVALLSTLCVTELVAPLERHPIRTKGLSLLFNIAHAGTGAALLMTLIRLWGLLGIKPLFEVSVRNYTGSIMALVLSLLFFDFLNYWNHRFQHRFLWRIHALHHCQRRLFAASSYGHFTERGLRWLLLALPLSIVQFDFPPLPWVILGIQEILELYIHSPTDIHFGWLRNVLVDNRFHRIHHSLQQQHFDKNFGVLFSIWDRLFGTALWPRADEWPEVGVAGLTPPKSVLETFLYPVSAFAPVWPKLRTAFQKREPNTFEPAALGVSANGRKS